MGVVTLVSGGLDSTLLSILLKEEGKEQYPLFIDYGQLSLQHEWESCLSNFEKHLLPKPVRMNLSGFGYLIKSGLTTSELDVKEDAFLPGRNLLFLIAAAAYACETNATHIAVGLLSEEFHIFPDQTKAFLLQAQKFISEVVMRELIIIAPLMHCTKQDIVELSKSKNINNTYSCHAGTIEPCTKCIACLEFAY